jgi:drug/metabolite transporter (DMT)-like permease
MMSSIQAPPSKNVSDKIDTLPLSSLLAVVAATACWGTSGVFVKFIVEGTGISALAMAFWRDLFTFLTLFTGLRSLRPGWLRLDRRDLVWVVALGSISVGTFHVLWNLAVMLNGVAVATVQQAAMPVFVALAAWLIWREPLTLRKILAIILTFGGTLLVSGLDALGQANLTWSGLLVGLGVPATYATFSLFGKQIAGRYHSLTILTYGFGFGALTLLPFQFFTPQPWPVPGASWLYFAGLICLSTILPFSLYTTALGKLPASVAGILAMSEIPFAALYGGLFFGERFTPAQLVGAVLVVGGILLLSWGRWRRQNNQSTS